MKTAEEIHATGELQVPPLAAIGDFRCFTLDDIRAIQLDAQPSDEVIDGITTAIIDQILSSTEATQVDRSPIKQILLKHLRP